QQRKKRFEILHGLVGLHPGVRIVQPASQPAANAGSLLDLLQQLRDGAAHRLLRLSVHAVIDVDAVHAPGTSNGRDSRWRGGPAGDTGCASPALAVWLTASASHPSSGAGATFSSRPQGCSPKTGE